MKDGILLSEKYGLNPTIPVCFWCGKQKNEIAMLGKIGGKGEDLEAPKNMVLDYEPCDDCKAAWGKGVALIEVSTTPLPDDRPPIQKGAYPTGRCLVVNAEALPIEAKAGDKALVLEEDFAVIISGVEEE